MKKLLIFFSTLTFLSLLALFSPPAVAALDLLPYFCPSSAPSVNMSSGEVFRCGGLSGNKFTIYKNANGTNYEKFSYDGSAIYHHEDNTWATAAGDVTCLGTGHEALFNLLDRRCGSYQNTCDCWDPNSAGMPWIGKSMNVGQTFTAPSGGTVVGFSEVTGDCCETAYTGPTDHSMSLIYQGCLLFPTDIVCDDGIELVITAGIGAGEHFYYCRNYGWVGFHRGTQGSGAYATSDLGATRTIEQAKEECLVITIQPDATSGLEFDCTHSSKPQTSRPNECELCNRTGRFCTACATDFQIFDNVRYQRKETEETDCLEKPWGGDITIDLDDISIPFVGYKDGESEQTYLADYFEGTNEYYENYNLYWQDWINYAGVFRKLSPMTYQNQLKENIVNRAASSSLNPGQEGSIHNYRLQYAGRLCWDFPLAIDLFIAILQRLDLPSLPSKVLDEVAHRSHYCLFATNDAKETLYSNIYKLIQKFNKTPKVPNFLKISASYSFAVGDAHDSGNKYYLLTLDDDDRLPPKPDEENYEEKWREWKEKDKEKDENEGKWFKLWQTVPMFSREDTPGQITTHVGTKPEDVVIFETPQNEIEKVPHVARLYEASGEIQQMLTPFWAEAQLAQKSHQSKAIIALPAPASDPFCYQAGPLPIENCNPPSFTDTDENDSLCCKDKPIEVELTALERFINPYGGYPQCYYDGKCKINHQKDPVCLLLKDEDIDCSTENPGECGNNPYFCCSWSDDCDNWEDWNVNRKVGIALRHPYLTNIWEQTTKADTQGVFNIFRPHTFRHFDDIDAHAQETITYQYSSSHDNNYDERAEPGDGNFYFNHLGGVQLAKDWTVKALLPYGFEGELPLEPEPTPPPAPGPYRIVGRVGVVEVDESGEEKPKGELNYDTYKRKITSNDGKTCTILDDDGYQIGRWAVGSKVTISMDDSVWVDNYDECRWTFAYNVDRSSGTGPTIGGPGCSAEVTISAGEGTSWSEDWANHFWFHLKVKVLKD